MFTLISIGGIIVVSFVLLMLSLRAYQRYKTTKMRFVLVAFGLFFVQGIVLSSIIVLPSSQFELVVTISVLIELICLLMIYAATFRR